MSPLSSSNIPHSAFCYSCRNHSFAESSYSGASNQTSESGSEAKTLHPDDVHGQHDQTTNDEDWGGDVKQQTHVVDTTPREFRPFFVPTYSIFSPCQTSITGIFNNASVCQNLFLKHDAARNPPRPLISLVRRVYEKSQDVPTLREGGTADVMEEVDEVGVAELEDGVDLGDMEVPREYGLDNGPADLTMTTASANHCGHKTTSSLIRNAGGEANTRSNKRSRVGVSGRAHAADAAGTSVGTALLTGSQTSDHEKDRKLDRKKSRAGRANRAQDGVERRKSARIANLKAKGQSQSAPRRAGAPAQSDMPLPSHASSDSIVRGATSFSINTSAGSKRFRNEREPERENRPLKRQRSDGIQYTLDSP